jgi:thiamine-monophosphate kinase
MIVKPEQPGLPAALSGEDELVAAIRRILSGSGSEVLVGPGDDAAVVRPGGADIVLTTDMLVEGVHFDRSLISARDLGYKAMVVNVSDVAAMGASPRHALVSLAIPGPTETAWTVELFGGMRTACDEYALSLVGGDLSSGREVVIAVTVTGEVPHGRAVLRSGAKPGERIVVTGWLGASAAGLALARERRHDALVADWGHELLDAHFRPVARVGEGQALAQAGAGAMMDLSDGLALDLARLCAESGVGARVDLSAIPVAAAVRQFAVEVGGAEPIDLAMSGGEDYELLATLERGGVERARRKLEERFGVPLTDIGEITEGSGLVAVGTDGSERPLEPKGWDHLAG